MPLTAPALSALTYGTYVGLIPTAAAAVRSNPAQGILPHSPPQKLINGLATGLVATIAALKWNGAITGAADPSGTAVPTTVVFPGSAAAVGTFLASAGWVGPTSPLVAQALIQSMLDNVAALSLLQGLPSVVVGTGTASFNPGLNASIASIAFSSLMGTLPVALQAEGVFGTGDVPGAPINPVLARTIPAYASAYAAGLATLTSTVPYIGTAAATTPAAGTVVGGLI